MLPNTTLELFLHLSGDSYFSRKWNLVPWLGRRAMFTIAHPARRRLNFTHLISLICLVKYPCSSYRIETDILHARINV